MFLPININIRQESHYIPERIKQGDAVSLIELSVPLEYSFIDLSIFEHRSSCS